MKAIDNNQLNHWFLKQRRALPWRESSSPYAVWVSEVMLQQTQVSVVIPYFLRWMELFPSVKTLAEAPLEAALKAWEGLGYYSRVRRLHEGARYLVRHHNGALPSNKKELSKVKGIGPYTIGAILSFAFQQRAVAVDGNVMRVLCRFWGIESEVDRVATKQKVELTLEGQLPAKQPWVAMEALIELGALVCQRIPRCSRCPLRSSCAARKEGKELTLPRKKRRAKTTLLHRLVAVIYTKSALLLRCGKQGKVMEGLWEFPYLELTQKPSGDMKIKVTSKFPIALTYQRALPQLSHTFTRFRAILYPELWLSESKAAVPGYQWIAVDDLKQCSFSSGHRRILHHWLTMKDM
ncbi:MAG: A/G-specific adenine glycosylase [Chlamydiota bacterium]